MGGSEATPNLFEFATSELSQDAVLCWLLSWADPKYEFLNLELHDAGSRLLGLLFKKHGLALSPVASVQVHRQVAYVDIVVEVGHEYILLIEDKTHTNHHGSQLKRYLKGMGKKYPGRQILPVFLKTGDQCDFLDVEECGFRVCERSDLLSCLGDQKQRPFSSDTLRDFVEYLIQREEMVRSFAHKPVSDWEAAQWIGFYKQLTPQIKDLKWHRVNNKGGGFMAAWWRGGQKRRTRLYLQIEEGPLCFKIYTGNSKSSSSLRKLWSNRVMKAGYGTRICTPQRPARFGSGKSMTVAVIPQSEWLAVSAKGILDMQRTVQRLNTTTRLHKRITSA
jgi:hypothetical protein